MALADVSSRSLADIVSLTGRTAVVTGAAWGLGKATARRLAEAGASVVIGDIDAEKAAATAQELSHQYGARVISIRMDVTDSAAIKATADQTVRDFGGIDIWINNAGVPSHVPLLDMSEEEWDRVMAVNLRGLFVGSREAARRMIAAGRGGVIVNLASLAGFRGIAPGQAAYVTSKHGVRGATRQMALELAPHGIRVLGVADDIARVVLFCASAMSLFMSGTTLLVDGGVDA